jgi:hypothetical protein
MEEYQPVEKALVAEYQFEWRIPEYDIRKAYSTKLMLDKQRV